MILFIVQMQNDITPDSGVLTGRFLVVTIAGTSREDAMKIGFTTGTAILALATGLGSVAHAGSGACDPCAAGFVPELDRCTMCAAGTRAV